MDKTFNIILIISLIATICLGLYCYILQGDIFRNEIMITELKEKASQLDRSIARYETIHQEIKFISENPLYIDYKKEAVLHLENNISKIVKSEPSFEGKWVTTKIDFITPFLVYVEYEDGHIKEKSLVRITKTPKKYLFEVIL